MKPSFLIQVATGLKKEGKLGGMSESGVMTQLAFRGYPKSHKARFDPGNGEVNTVWVRGVRERVEWEGGEVGADA